MTATPSPEPQAPQPRAGFQLTAKTLRRVFWLVLLLVVLGLVVSAYRALNSDGGTEGAEQKSASEVGAVEIWSPNGSVTTDPYASASAVAGGTTTAAASQQDDAVSAQTANTAPAVTVKPKPSAKPTEAPGALAQDNSPADDGGC